MADMNHGFHLCLLGLTCKKLGQQLDAIDAFIKLNAIIPDTPEVVAQIAQLYEGLHAF